MNWSKYLFDKKIFKQLFKYSIVGIFNALIGLGIIFVLYNLFDINYIIANIVGYAFGLTNSFIWNKSWTFKSKKHYSKEILPFLIIFIISYIINLVVLIASVEIVVINPNISQLLAAGFYTAINFLLNRKWTFSQSI